MEKEVKKTIKKIEPSGEISSHETPVKATVKSTVKAKTPVNTNPLKKEGFAIIETGGKQYRVFSGDTITIEKLSDDKKVGDKVIFDKVLLVDDGKNTKVGTPYIEGEKVEGIFEEEGRGKKISVIKYKRKVRYRRKYGHRQPFAKVTIK